MKNGDKTKIATIPYIAQVLQDVIVESIIMGIAIYVYIITFPNSFTVPPEKDILLITWNEIINIATLAPVLFTVTYNAYKFKNSRTEDRILRAAWSILGVIILTFYRVAIVAELHSVVIVIVAIAQFAITFLFKYSGPLIAGYCNIDSSQVSCVNQLKNCLGNVRNKRILSVQLFSCEEVESGDYTEFRFTCIDHLLNKVEDTNCLLFTKLYLKTSDYEYFRVAYDTYGKIVDTDSEEKKKLFVESVRKSKDEIKSRLEQVDYETVTKEDCCLARLLVCYMNLEKMVSTPGYAPVEIQPGELGLDMALEERLFTLVRTGLLATVLFGADHQYMFRYWRRGIKDGRRYCSSVLEFDSRKYPLVVDLITISESTNHIGISYSLLEYIKRCEKTMVAQYEL